MTKRKRFTNREIIDALAKLHDMRHADGRPNLSEISRATGLPAPTLTRIYNGPAGRNLSGNTIEALCKTFHISFAQARGHAPIKRSKSATPTDAEADMLQQFRALSAPDRQRILAFIDGLTATRGTK